MDTMINPLATEARFVLYRANRGEAAEVLNIVNTERGVKTSQARRLGQGVFRGYAEYGWYREELVNGEWIRL